MANDILKNSLSEIDDFSKIFEIINIVEINSSDEANSLIYYLTDCANPLREACAFKLEELCLKNSNYFLNDFSRNKFLNGIVDINPNVSRAVCSILSKSVEISQLLEPDIILKINSVLDEIKIYEKIHKDFFSGSIRNTKNHAKNKKLFALYWLLEALFFCFSGKYNSEVLEILNVTINFYDFTIREKTAQLLIKTINPPLELLKKAKQDQNFYVKIQVYDKINFDD